MLKKLRFLSALVLSILILKNEVNAQCGTPKPGDPLPVFSKMDPACFGESTGEITVSMYGSNFPYPYNWELWDDIGNLKQSGYASSQFAAINGGTISGLYEGLYYLYTCDNNNERYTNTIILTSPPPLNVYLTFKEPSCIEAADGEMTANVTGGIAPYSYSWSNQESSMTITGISAGQEMGVYPTDANGCTASTSGPMPSPLNPTLYINPIGSKCEGELLSFSSNTSLPNPSYSWSGPNSFVSLEQNPVITGQAAAFHGGWYYLNVTNGPCSLVDSILVQINPAPTSVFTQVTNETCNNTNGQIDIGVTVGGTAPYMYSLNSGSFSPTLIYGNLAAGTYTLNVLDVNGCILNAPNLYISNLSGPTSLNVSTYDETCLSANGIVDIALVNGGTAPYDYNFNGGGYSASSYYTGLASGMYTLSVKDVNGCIFNAPNAYIYNIAGPSFVNIFNTDETCSSGNGAINFGSVSGGTAPYTFSVNGSSHSSATSYSNLVAGTYTLSVKDANACELNPANATLINLEAPSLDLSHTDVNCYGGNDGAATVNVLSGNGPYIYYWSNSASSNSISFLTVNSYSVSVTDVNGCVSNGSVTINEPNKIPLSLDISTSSICSGDNVNLVASGADNYYWSPSIGLSGSTGSTITASPSSSTTYTLVGTDINACTADTSFTIVVSPVPNVTIIKSKPSLCEGDNLTLNASGAASYYWNPPTGLSSTVGNVVVANPSVTTTYTVFGTDFNGCMSSFTETVYVSPLPSVNAISTSTCGVAGGEITAFGAGGAPAYTYSIDGTNYYPSNVFNPSTAGSYILTILDANNCSNSTSVVVEDYNSLSLSISSLVHVSCSGGSDGSITVAASGNTSPYNYSIDNVNFSPANTFNNLPSGNYTLKVKDGNNCESVQQVTLNEATPINHTFNKTDATCGMTNGSATVSTTGGTPSYTFLWSNGSTSSSASNLSASQYSVVITDAMGCQITGYITIGNSNGPSIVSATSQNSTCPSLCDGSATLSVSGGLAPYTYSWINLPQQIAATATGICSGSYSVIVKDANDCSASTTITVGSTGTNPSLEGNVNSSLGAAIRKGKVQLFGVTASGAFGLISSTTIDTGYYSFPNFPAGNYLIAATADSLEHPYTIRTFYDMRAKWMESDTLGATCNQNLNIDLQVIDLTPMNGNGTISGTVVNVTGGKRTSEPLPGVDISLEEDPDGIIKANTQTDENGFFKFTNVNDGNYKIHVDIPGLGMVQTYSITINENDTIFENKNFYVDSTSTINTIYVPSGISTFNNSKISTKAIPNPYKGATTLNFSLEEKGTIVLEVFNLLGKKITTLENALKEKGEYNYRFSAKELGETPGIYFVRLHFNGNTSTLLVIETE